MKKVFLLLVFLLLVLACSAETYAQWCKIPLHGGKVSYYMQYCDSFPGVVFPYKYEDEARIPQKVESLFIDLSKCSKPEVVLKAFSEIPSKHLRLTGLKNKESVEILNLFKTEELFVGLSLGIDPAPVLASLKRKVIVGVSPNEASLLVPFLTDENIAGVSLSLDDVLTEENSESVRTILESDCPLRLLISSISPQGKDLILGYGDTLRKRESIETLFLYIDKDYQEIVSVLPVAKKEDYFCYGIMMSKLQQKEFRKDSDISIHMDNCSDEKEFLENLLERDIHLGSISIDVEKLPETLSAIVKLSPSGLSINGEKIGDGVDLSALKSVPLTYLNLKFGSSKPLDLTWFADIKTLSNLKVAVPVSPESCEVIASMKELHSLTISDNDASNVCKCIANPNLESISIDFGRKVADENILASIASEKVAVLTISNLESPLKLEGIVLKRLSSLRRVELSNCKEVTGKNLLSLGTNQMLYMIVDRCQKVEESTVKQLVSKSIYVEYKTELRRDDTFEGCLDGLFMSFFMKHRRKFLEKYCLLLTEKYGYKPILQESWFLVVPNEASEKNAVYYAQDYSIFEAKDVTKEQVAQLIEDLPNISTRKMLREKYSELEWKRWSYKGPYK